MFGRRFYIVVFLLGLFSGALLMTRPAGDSQPSVPPDIEQRISILKRRLAKVGNDTDLLSDLAGAYMRKARAAGGQQWYSKAQQAAERAALDWVI